MNDNVINNNGLFELGSLRGGLDDTTPKIALAPDACTVADNVEFVSTMLGERRQGCVEITLSSEFADVAVDAVTWMFRHLPSGTDQTNAELWALVQSLTTTSYALMRRQTAAWAVVPIIIDTIDVTATQGHKMSAQTLHNKLFIAHKSAQNRLHVFDGTTLRRAGVAAPAAAPTGANTGVGGLSGARDYRVRFVEMSGAIVVRRSEPSAVLLFTPSGAGLAVRVTRPATVNEGETHWELEASVDGANYYRIARTILATTTFDDTVSTTTGYVSIGVLSADIGDYTTIPSGKFLSADEDRLLVAGSWEDPAEASRVRWTPTSNAPGNGNDERMEADSNPYLDLDGYEGGDITAMSKAVSGYIYVFKRSHIYKLVRNGTRINAYTAVPITKSKGALPGSLVEAVTQAGKPSLFFLDPTVGPMRLAAEGLQWCGRDIQTIWTRVNINAKVPCHGVYYSSKRQLHYWLALDGSDYPNYKVVLHVNEMRDLEEGARRGWVTVTKDSRIATAHCSVMAASNTDTTAVRSYALVPFIGKEKWVVSASTIRNYIQRCDTGSKDAHTTNDTLSTYRGVVSSKSFALVGLLNQYEAKGGAIAVTASVTPTGTMFVKLTRDFGKEDLIQPVAYYTTGTESTAIVQLPGLVFSDLYALQVTFGDLDTNATPPATWGTDLFQLAVVAGLRAVGGS